MRWHTAVLIVVLDALTKQWVRAEIPLGAEMKVNSFLSLTHIQNTGISFGMLQGFPQVMTLITLLITALLIYYREEIATNAQTTYALALILGGAVGNLIDRILFQTVTDFIDFHFWPAFNIADTAICIGAIVWVYNYRKE